MAPLFDIQNKKDRLKQRFNTLRKEMRIDASKKISDVVTRNAAIIDLSRVKSRSGRSRAGMFGDTIAMAVAKKKEVQLENEQKRIQDMPGLALPEKAGRGEKRKKGFYPIFLSRPRMWWGAFGGILVLVFLLLTFVFDHVTVMITPAEAHFLLKGVSIGADTSLHALDVSTKRLPALRIEVTKSAQKTFPTSGKKYVQSRAEGVITLTNTYSIKSQQLVQNTRFVEQGGKVFRLIHGVVIPGASMKNGKLAPSVVDVEVIADQPGNDYNVSSTNFKIPGFVGTPKYDGFLAVSRNAFSGGYIGETRFATDNDIRSASEQVTKEVYDSIKTELAGKIPSGFVAPDGARFIQITDVKKPLGLMIGDSFEFSASGSGFIIFFKQSDFTQLLETVVVPSGQAMSFQGDKSQITFSKIVIRQAPLEIRRQEASADAKRIGSLTGQGGSGFDAIVDGDALFRYRIDSDSIKKGIISLSREGADQWLRTRQDIASFELKVFPAWIRSMPSSASSISSEVR